MQNTSKSSINRNAQIDMFKGLAILLVITYHFFYRYVELYEPQTKLFLLLSKCGVVGVTIFLSISGYLMFTGTMGGINYVVKKIIRLWPTYAITITICFVLTHIIGLPGRTVGIKEFILNIFFINGFINVPYVDSAHWYITALIGCIFVYAIIGLLPQKDKWKALVLTEILCTIISVLLDYVICDSVVFHIVLALLGGKHLTMLIMGSAVRCLEENKNLRGGVHIICYNINL